MRGKFNTKYLNNYDLKSLTKSITELNELIFYYRIAVKKYWTNSKSADIKITLNSNHNICDMTGNAIIKLENMKKAVDRYDRKIKYLKKNVLTSDEWKIFHYSIEKGESTEVIMDLINKSEKTYYKIKKSAFLKIALEFNLVELKLVDTVSEFC